MLCVMRMHYALHQECEQRYTLFNVGSLFRTFSTRFEPPYSITYHMGLSHGAVPRDVLRLKIYGATSVSRIFTKILQLSL